MFWLMISSFGLAGAYYLLRHRGSGELVTEADYDERQRLLRGQSYQYGLFIVWGLCLLFTLVNVGFPGLLSLEFVLMTFFSLPILVVGAVTIVTGAYYPVSPAKQEQRRTPAQGMFTGAVIAGLSVFLALIDDQAAGFFQKGGLGGIALLGLAGLVIMGAFAYRLWLDKKEDEE